ncbi:MAG: hypothetical protein JRF38_14170 [Deltaproteobacteria bacterium]|nr:hypothetical protein [Deltaproteobacteria bacterium]
MDHFIFTDNRAGVVRLLNRQKALGPDKFLGKAGCTGIKRQGKMSANI